MMRLLFSAVCLIFLSVTSCNNNNEVQNADTVPDQEKQLRGLVTRFPDSLLLYENLVQFFRDKGNYNQAIKATETVLKADSLNDRFLDIKATLHFENGDTINAIKAFEKAVSINPRPEYIISLGSLYAQTKNPMALAMADALLQAPAANAQKQALFIKGLYFSYTGEKVKALAFFNNCLKLDYRDVLAYREKAICLYDLNKYATAVDVLKQAVAVQNTFDEGYYWMGRCYEKLDKRKEAADSYRQALQIDPDYGEAKDALGKMGVE
ncbi:MAG: tetratricopeptide repeat protein [Ferruginibacter sp.]|nr:tetratricopeptide repeat protein [Ferruginibacter sp.]